MLVLYYFVEYRNQSHNLKLITYDYLYEYRKYYLSLPTSIFCITKHIDLHIETCVIVH